ncbi:ubiquinol-cytochrome-c reductase complex assembly factor 1-like isoform X2 [Asterias amurensis]|uniref:ubiquinol-cytochrome-c reductase complex assembly factor 1-like isoform X2 n=1 Tax=Asterias amurensis TaxID=7602 RepID=UPI003AB55234
MYSVCYRSAPMAFNVGSVQIVSRGIQTCCRSLSVRFTTSAIQSRKTSSNLTSSSTAPHADLTYSRWCHMRKVASPQHATKRHINTTPQSQALVRRSAVLPEKKPGPISRLLTQVGIPTQMRYNRFKIRVAGLNLYTSCVDNVDCQKFFLACGMPDTLFSWFLVTELHVWMCMVRLKQEGQEGKYMTHYLIMSMWHDVQERGKLMGIPAVKMRESLSRMVEQFNAALFSYDEGLLSNDSVLAGALWRNIFVKRDIEAEQVADMVEYVRQQVQYLETLDTAQLLQVGRIKWLPFRAEVPVESAPPPRASSIEEELEFPNVDKVNA